MSLPTRIKTAHPEGTDALLTEALGHLVQALECLGERSLGYDFTDAERAVLAGYAQDLEIEERSLRDFRREVAARVAEHER